MWTTPHKYDWKEIQQSYDSGISYRGLTKKFGVSQQALNKARKRGDLVTRPQGEAVKVWQAGRENRGHTMEARAKMSRLKKLALELHPEYAWNGRKQSYPEAVFEKTLKEKDIGGFEKEYPFKRFFFDFAFLQEKIDVEIDGAQHLEPKSIERDRERDREARKAGWIVLRFPAEKIKNDLEGCIASLQIILSEKRKMEQNGIAKGLARGKTNPCKSEVKTSSNSIV